MSENNKQFDENILNKIIESKKNTKLYLDKKTFVNKFLDTKANGSASSINKNLKFSCSFPNCRKAFGKKDRLVLHERIHTGERPFKCRYERCNRSYTRQFHLTRHVAVFHAEKVLIEETDEFSCNICSKTYSNKYSLKKHLRVHNEQRFSCPDCSETFTKHQHLKTHSSQHTGLFPYRCEHPGCDKGFALPSKLSRHSKVHLPDRYPCHYQNCTEKFNKYAELIKHLAEFHAKVCDICGKEFKQLSRLRHHLLSHQETREVYFCPYSPCERYYVDPRNLQKHIDVKHEKNSKGFNCLVCDKWLVTKQKLKEHIKLHDPHKKIPAQKKQKPKSRKDKGTIKKNFAKFLSGYEPDKSLPDNFSTNQKQHKDCSIIVPSKVDTASINVLQDSLNSDLFKSCLKINNSSPEYHDGDQLIAETYPEESNCKTNSVQEGAFKEKREPLNILQTFNTHNLKVLFKKGSFSLGCKLPQKINKA